MSLKQELKDLRRQRRAELLTLNHTYVATKHDLKRTLSPDRFVRKHIGFMLATAATAGLLIAPRPTPAEAPASRPVTMGGRIRDFLDEALSPPAAETTEKKTPKPKKRHRGVVTSLLAYALKNVDIKLLVSQIVAAIAARRDQAQAVAASDGSALSPNSDGPENSV